jgi:hypothetical protein
MVDVEVVAELQDKREACPDKEWVAKKVEKYLKQKKSLNKF